MRKKQVIGVVCPSLALGPTVTKYAMQLEVLAICGKGALGTK